MWGPKPPHIQFLSENVFIISFMEETFMFAFTLNQTNFETTYPEDLKNMERWLQDYGTLNVSINDLANYWEEFTDATGWRTPNKSDMLSFAKFLSRKEVA